MRQTTKATVLLSLASIFLFPRVGVLADNTGSECPLPIECIRLAKRRCVLVENHKCNANKSILGALLDPGNYAGTGVIIQKNLVLTSCHILRPNSDILVDDKVATVLKKSNEHDLLLLWVETEGVPKITIDELTNIGECVFYVGNSGQSKDVLVPGHIVEIDAQFIYTDAFEDIEEAMGASGSGLYSQKGHLIGLQKGMLNGGSGHGCLSVSIPAARIKEFLGEYSRKDFSHRWH
jgi:hypothetical protein